MKFDKPNGIFLAGLIDGDGHISKKCITISFHKRDIKAQEIQNYLGHGGITNHCR
jgi:hypothetical protein